MDSNFFQGIKNIFTSNEPKKELVDPYVIFSFAGKKVNKKFLEKIEKEILVSF